MRRSNPFLFVFLACGLTSTSASGRGITGVVGEAGVSAGSGSAAAGASRPGSSLNTGNPLALPGSTLPGVPSGGQYSAPNLSVTPNLGVGNASVNPSATSGASVNVNQDAGNATASVSPIRQGAGVGGNAVTPSGSPVNPNDRPGAQTDASLRGEGAVRTPSGGPEAAQASGESAKTGVATVDSVGGEFRKANIDAAGGDVNAVANASERIFAGGQGRGAVGAAGTEGATSLAGSMDIDAAEKIRINTENAQRAAQSDSLAARAQAPAFLVEALAVAKVKSPSDVAKISAVARRYGTPAALSELGNKALSAASSGNAADQKLFTASVQNWNKALTENPNEPHFTDIGAFSNAVERTVKARLEAQGKSIKAPTVRFVPTAGSGAARVKTVVDLPSDFAAAIKPLAAGFVKDMALDGAALANDPVLDPAVVEIVAMDAAIGKMLPQAGFWGILSKNQREAKTKVKKGLAVIMSLIEFGQITVQGWWEKLRTFFLSLFFEAASGFSVDNSAGALTVVRAAPATAASFSTTRSGLPKHSLGYSLYSLVP